LSKVFGEREPPVRFACRVVWGMNLAGVKLDDGEGEMCKVCVSGCVRDESCRCLSWSEGIMKIWIK